MTNRIEWVAAVLLWGGGAWGQSEQQPQTTEGAAPAASAEERIDALAEELRRLKLEIGIPDVTYQQYAGMGPAASKVYFVPRGLSIGGYGELVANYFPQQGQINEADLLRLILYVGYRFNDWIVFNSEIEFEHAHSAKGGEVAVEFAYLDFKLVDALQLRVGNVLVPMGFINEVHEPPFFHGVLRPDVERNLLPSTWNENGLGLFGEALGVRYKAYVVAGLNAIESGGDGGFSEASWIRNGRQRGARAFWENVAVVGSVSYDHDLFGVGVSAFFGRSGQGASYTPAAGTPQVVKAETFVTEAHARFSYRGLQAKALVVRGTLGDAAEVTLLQRANDVTGVVASEVVGGYAELAYDLLSVVRPGSEQLLAPFVRYERVNLHSAVPAGFEINEARNTNLLTAGITWKPTATVAVKFDYQRRWAPAIDGSNVDQVNGGVGFVF